MSDPKINTLLVRALEELAGAEHNLRGLSEAGADAPILARASNRLAAAGNHAREIIQLAKLRVT